MPSGTIPRDASVPTLVKAPSGDFRMTVASGEFTGAA